MAQRRSSDSASTESTFAEEPVDPRTLLLDPHNPRLTLEEEGSSQDELLLILLRRFKVEELAQSIIASGYNSFDPIVAYRDSDAVIVREGNRRVATIKLLLDPTLAPERYCQRWQELSGELPSPVRQQIERLSVRIYPERSAADVTSYIGFRHVTGVLKWPALEKAKFIAQLVEDQGLIYRKIAERLGSYPKHMERHYVAYRLVCQVIDEGVPGSTNIQKAFGVLLRALQASGIPEFLGVSYPHDPGQSETPVPPDHLDNLRDFVKWGFGTQDTARILPDSRRLTDFGQILQSTVALNYMRRTPKPVFDRAFFKSGGQASSLVNALFTAADRLEESVPIVPEHRTNDEVIDAVSQCTNYLAQMLKYFPPICEKYGVSFQDDRSSASGSS